MSQFVEQRLSRFVSTGQAALLRSIRIGLEKESLRVNPEGGISQRSHPASLGAALTNPYITTDYSEALLELITPAFPSITEALVFLEDVHRFVYARLEDDEFLWATSMPCALTGEEGVPIAQYGHSNPGMMKTVYRRGLGYRYGRIMQVIAGVHFNFSFTDEFWTVFKEHEQDAGPWQEFVSDRYFGMLRNLQRVGWLIPYLFGASPAVCKSFMNGKQTDLQELDADTYYAPYATSLRMGDIGYQNNKENEVGVKACYDSLDEYVDTLTFATQTAYPGYEKFGVKVDGEYRQLNANLLQIENEYYSTVRPKPLLEGNEKPTLALKRRGVRYLELRSLDVNACEPLGINEDQLRFLHALMVFCLFQQSPRISPLEREAIDANEMAAAQRGREPGLMLRHEGGEQSLQSWAMTICDDLEPICAALDEGEPGQPYAQALARQRLVVADPELTPSARMLAEMQRRGESFHHMAKRLSREHQHHFLAVPMDAQTVAFFEDAARESQEKQRGVEAADTLGFDEYLEQYFSQSL